MTFLHSSILPMYIIFLFFYYMAYNNLIVLIKNIIKVYEESNYIYSNYLSWIIFLIKFFRIDIV